MLPVRRRRPFPSKFIVSVSSGLGLHHLSQIHTHDKPSNPVSPFTKETFITLLQRHSSERARLQEIHGILLTTGLSVKNFLLTHILISLTSLGDMAYAHQILDQMHKPRSFLWNTVIKGYLKHHFPALAISLYHKMRAVGVRPDEHTYTFLIKSCGEMSDFCAGTSVHADAHKFGLEYIVPLKTELIRMYVNAGDFKSADYLFDTMLGRDLIAWNAYISACLQAGNAAKSLRLFNQMRTKGIKADIVATVSAISACGHLGFLEMGVNLYQSFTKESTGYNIILNNAFLDMYTKCGNIELAERQFVDMPYKNVISWSTMIGGYAINGESERAVTLFERMKLEGFHPNSVTFLWVLCACSHAGLITEGWAYFDNMLQSEDMDLQPGKEHYSCMVSLLGRLGRLDEAYDFIRSMPIEADSGIWGALLSACALHRNVKLGQCVADSLLELAPDVSAYRVLLSNMYATAGRWDSVRKVRLKMDRKKVKKIPGYSSIECDDDIHVFYYGDRSHPQAESIYVKLDSLIFDVKVFGYVPGTSSVFHDVDSEESEAAVSSHSEKLALSFGLISLREEVPIRVMKNLRTCEDCHAFFKFVSMVYKRDIILRDKIRFHHFKEGSCSCKDFW